MLAVGVWLMAIAFGLLACGVGLLALRSWLLAVGFQFLAVAVWVFGLLAVGCWRFAPGSWLWVFGNWWLASVVGVCLLALGFLAVGRAGIWAFGFLAVGRLAVWPFGRVAWLVPLDRPAKWFVTPPNLDPLTPGAREVTSGHMRRHFHALDGATSEHLKGHFRPPGVSFQETYGVARFSQRII